MRAGVWVGRRARIRSGERRRVDEQPDRGTRGRGSCSLVARLAALGRRRGGRGRPEQVAHQLRAVGFEDAHGVGRGGLDLGQVARDVREERGP